MDSLFATPPVIKRFPALLTKVYANETLKQEDLNEFSQVTNVKSRLETRIVRCI
jgi:hypothetical protein